jgi:hypothetical protein
MLRTTAASWPPSTRCPVREQLASWVLNKRQKLQKTGKRASGAWLVDHERLFVYACDAFERYASTKDFSIWLAAATQSRREAVAEQIGRKVPAVGIGALVRTNPAGVAYSYCHLDGELPSLPRRCGGRSSAISGCSM